MTSTSSFGVSGRVGHDSSEFYARFPPLVLSTDTTIAACRAAGRVIVGDSRNMDAVADSSVALVVTSPPYFAGKDYELALGHGAVPGSYIEYLEMVRDVLAEAARTLEPGGRMAVNVANLGRKPFRPLSADVWRIVQEDLRLLPRGEIVWQKAVGASGSCAFGSWLSPNTPVLRDLTERVLVASKGRFDRALSWRERQERGLPWRATITKADFLPCTLDVWHVSPESARRVNHPAPYPVELVRRLIELYTYEDDVVLDPFVGSGTTAVAAIRTGRRYVGYELDPSYARRARARVRAELDALRDRESTTSASGVVNQARMP